MGKVSAVDWEAVPVIVTGTPCPEAIEAIRQAVEDFAFESWRVSQAPAPLGAGVSDGARGHVAGQTPAPPTVAAETPVQTEEVLE